MIERLKKVKEVVGEYRPGGTDEPIKGASVYPLEVEERMLAELLKGKAIIINSEEARDSQGNKIIRIREEYYER
jgi:hypothetical protein